MIWKELAAIGWNPLKWVIMTRNSTIANYVLTKTISRDLSAELTFSSELFQNPL